MRYSGDVSFCHLLTRSQSNVEMMPRRHVLGHRLRTVWGAHKCMHIHVDRTTGGFHKWLHQPVWQLLAGVANGPKGKKRAPSR